MSVSSFNSYSTETAVNKQQHLCKCYRERQTDFKINDDGLEHKSPRNSETYKKKNPEKQFIPLKISFINCKNKSKKTKRAHKSDLTTSREWYV